VPLHLAVGVEHAPLARPRRAARAAGGFRLTWDPHEAWALEIGSGRVSPSYGVALPIVRLLFQTRGTARARPHVAHRAPGRIVTGVQRVGWAALVAASVGSAAVALVVWPRLFDSTPAGVGTLVSARCEGSAGTACAVRSLAISAGRYWLDASAGEANRLSLDFELPATRGAAALLLGAGASGLAAGRRVRPRRFELVAGRDATIGRRARRRVLQLSGIAGAGRVRVTLVRPDDSGNRNEGLRVEEVGLFARDDACSPTPRVPAGRPGPPALQRPAGASLSVARGSGNARRLLRALRPRRVVGRAGIRLFLTLAATSVELWVEHNPYWYRARDLRVMLASGPVQEGVGSNLNYGCTWARGCSRAKGSPSGRAGCRGSACRIRLVRRARRSSRRVEDGHLHDRARLDRAAPALLRAGERRLRDGGGASHATGSRGRDRVLVIFMPNQLANTQADSIMVPCYLLTAAALCLYLDRERQGAAPPIGYHLLVHLSFALWFLMRPEGVVGWAALSLILYWRSPRYLALPAALYLAIGLSWGAYKRQYTGEFSMTTNTIGDNAWISLWQDAQQVPVADDGRQLLRVRNPPRRKAALQACFDAALREVARFAATYPVYVAHVALHKFVAFVDVNVFNGIRQLSPTRLRRLRGPAVWFLMAVVGCSLVLPYEGRRALLLGWPLVFNLPLFLFFFSDDMRHVAPVTASLLVTGVVPLFEASFYRRSRPGAVGSWGWRRPSWASGSCCTGPTPLCSPRTAGATGRRSWTRRRSSGIYAEDRARRLSRMIARMPTAHERRR
jgi:hypothetical protein